MRSATECEGPGRKLERTRKAVLPSRKSRLAGCTWSISNGREAMIAPSPCSFSINRAGKTPFGQLPAMCSVPSPRD